jgi:hypothetical protein
VLRDIRDLRGETQQALGRLLGWSVSTVSRFEAAYPDYPALRLFGDEAKPLPVWAEAAPREQWADVEAPLGTLDLLGAAARCAPLALLGGVLSPGRAGLPAPPGGVGPTAPRDRRGQAGASRHLDQITHDWRP